MKNLLKHTMIRTKIFLLLGLTLTLMSLVTAVGLWQVSVAGERTTILTKFNVSLTGILNRITFNSMEQRILFERVVQHGMAMSQDTITKDDFETARKGFFKHGQAITQEIAKGEKLLGQLLGTCGTSYTREKAVKIDYELRNLSKQHSDYLFATKRVLNLLSHGRTAQVQTTIEKIQNIHKQNEEPLENLLLAVEDYIQDSTDRAHQSKQVAIIGMSLFSVLILLFGSCFGVFISRSISVPINKLVFAAARIGKGDLESRIEIDSNDEISQLAESLNRMVEDLNTSTTSIDHLNAINQQLEASQQQLDASNQQLQAENIERRQAEENLTSANERLEQTVEKLARSNTELQEFVYIASHDLREPLRKISSFGELVKNSLSEGLEEDDKENLDFMIDGAERMTQMIEALLVYSRLNTKDITLSTVDLNEIIEQFGQLELATLFEETNTTVDIPQTLPTVTADKVLIRQLMQNLIVNGIKYQKPGIAPRIEITARQIDNDKVRIELKDNGIGIKKEMHQTIFKMFKRVHSKEKYQGTGIGLAVCKKIAERHGSQIGVDSKEGEGSVFWFTMSLEKEPATVS